MIASHSPAASAVRVYGTDGPRFVAGIPAGVRLAGVGCGALPSPPGERHVVDGTVELDGHEVNATFRFGLTWRLEGATPLIEEVLPCPGFRPERLREWWPGAPVANANVPPAPEPQSDLDDVARELWRVRLAGVTLPLRLRCLTALWRLPLPTTVTLDLPATVQAAAILRLVSTRAGVRITTNGLADHYGHDHDTLKQAERSLQRRLALSTTTVW